MPNVFYYHVLSNHALSYRVLTYHVLSCPHLLLSSALPSFLGSTLTLPNAPIIHIEVLSRNGQFPVRHSSERLAVSAPLVIVVLDLNVHWLESKSCRRVDESVSQWFPWQCKLIGDLSQKASGFCSVCSSGVKNEMLWASGTESASNSNLECSLKSYSIGILSLNYF